MVEAGDLGVLIGAEVLNIITDANAIDHARHR
jgi:hypothetical protein